MPTQSVRLQGRITAFVLGNECPALGAGGGSAER